MTNEYGYHWPEWNEDTRCECGKIGDYLCNWCGELSCEEILCHGCRSDCLCVECENTTRGKQNILGLPKRKFLILKWRIEENPRTGEHGIADINVITMELAETLLKIGHIGQIIESEE